MDRTRKEEYVHSQSVGETTLVLGVTDDARVIRSLEQALDTSRYTLALARNESDAISFLKRQRVGILVFDIEKASRENIDLVSFVQSTAGTVRIVAVAPEQRLREANQAIRYGAALYLAKPVEPEDLRIVLSRLAGDLVLRAERKDFEYRAIHDLMGGSDSMRRILHLAGKVAPTTSTVLIGGETGTGKELLARVIHRLSNRENERFVPVNCGAIPENLFESELFGHRKGSFTGADRDKPGLVESADMGTLFLDEVGDLPVASQVKLLRFLQERTFRRVGETADRKVNVRVIAATNRDLGKMVEQGVFREDLFFRLCVFHMHVPPLRDRKETIPQLVRFFVHKYNQMHNRHIARLTKGAEQALMRYEYPGNVRELENIIEHAVALADSDEITERDLPDHMVSAPLLLQAPAKELDKSGDGFPTLEEMERRHIEEALKRTEYNYSRAADALGVCRATLWRKMKMYGLSKR